MINVVPLGPVWEGRRQHGRQQQEASKTPTSSTQSPQPCSALRRRHLSLGPQRTISAAPALVSCCPPSPAPPRDPLSLSRCESHVPLPSGRRRMQLTKRERTEHAQLEQADHLRRTGWGGLEGHGVCLQRLKPGAAPSKRLLSKQREVSNCVDMWTCHVACRTRAAQRPCTLFTLYSVRQGGRMLTRQLRQEHVLAAHSWAPVQHGISRSAAKAKYLGYPPPPHPSQHFGLENRPANGVSVFAHEGTGVRGSCRVPLSRSFATSFVRVQSS